MLFIAACKPSSAPPAAAPPAEAPRQASISAAPHGQIGAVSNDGTYYVSYTPKPSPIPLNEMFELSVWVSTAQDRTKALNNMQLQVDAVMPEHDHGMNTKPKTSANPDGSFTVAGMLFHMPGHWELYCDVTREGVTERAQFDVELE